MLNKMVLRGGAAVLAAMLCLHVAHSLAANDEFETFKKQQREGMQKTKKEFVRYKEKQDAEFADFLKTQWGEFDTFKGKVRIKEPKPKAVPVAVVPVMQPPIIPQPDPAPPLPAVIPALPVIAPAAPPILARPKPTPQGMEALNLTFYGNAITLPVDPVWKSYRVQNGVKPAAMSAFWGVMSSSQYEATINAINAARNALKLDDWGHVSLWRDAANALQPNRTAEQNLLLWYFLIKSGYDVRLGYEGNEIHLFIAARQQIFSTQFTSVGSQTYYAALATDRGKSIGRFYTYEANYPIKLKPIDLQSASTRFTKTVAVQRKLEFVYHEKKVGFNIPYDGQLVKYMATFPQSEFELYFATDGSALVRQSLLAELKRYTSTMDEESAVNFLLAFVQKSFAYKTDDEQFGYEKYFFVEELMHFPYADCEDRSVLFAWLVHELLGAKVVGLVYPGHMTTAVALKNIKTEFATVDFQGSRLVIADPTYIGASVGMAMPSYARLKPSRIISQGL